MTSSFLYGTFRANERVCSDTDHFCKDSDRFCSFDNWLCDPISKNWQLTLIYPIVTWHSRDQLIFHGRLFSIQFDTLKWWKINFKVCLKVHNNLGATSLCWSQLLGFSIIIDNDLVAALILNYCTYVWNNSYSYYLCCN